MYIYYNDSSFLFYYLYNHFSEFSLIEDGLRIYDKLDFSLFRNILFFVFRHPHILRDGRSPKIKEIYVQSPELIKDRRAKKTRKLDLKALINNITNEDKKNLIEFYFQTSTSYMNFNKKSVLILTQPLTKSNNVPLQKLLDLYKTIIYFMKQRNYNVYLKPHPVDDTPYNAYFKDIYILPKDIPIEAFNLFERHDLFDLAIALYSSAINNINFVERRLNLFCNNNWQKNLKTDIKEVLYDYVREEI
ncbi:polysialyltransferase family glycosyltransferase [Kosmotoga sp. DU53]|uniref:polysialyltransferase family glycosyltransferase n=1 Tax=Kosmotoga sp. DU53 TaxID=1310160 RepID=UPI003511BF87